MSILSTALKAIQTPLTKAFQYSVPKVPKVAEKVGTAFWESSLKTKVVTSVATIGTVGYIAKAESKTKAVGDVVSVIPKATEATYDIGGAIRQVQEGKGLINTTIAYAKEHPIATTAIGVTTAVIAGSKTMPAAAGLYYGSQLQGRNSTVNVQNTSGFGIAQDPNTKAQLKEQVKVIEAQAEANKKQQEELLKSQEKQQERALDFEEKRLETEAKLEEQKIKLDYEKSVLAVKKEIEMQKAGLNFMEETRMPLQGYTPVVTSTSEVIPTSEVGYPTTSTTSKRKRHYRKEPMKISQSLKLNLHVGRDSRKIYIERGLIGV